HFIGEVVDVTGWLGGYNFQWAWASGAAAGASTAGRSASLAGGAASTDFAARVPAGQPPLT
ncbi:MAG: hypothetical protein ACK6C0_13770, partial [Betaproteobacteria bacterium]